MILTENTTPRLQLNKAQKTVVLPRHQNQSRQSICRHILKWLNNDWWIAKKIGFPYPEGWAVYNPKKRTILETGLNKTHAKLICRELNGKGVCDERNRL